MRIALAQINSVMGDFDGNIQKMLDWTQKAIDKRCDLIVFPEMSSFGYSANDLLERPEVLAKQASSIKNFYKKKPKNIAVIFGGIASSGKGDSKPLLNAAFISTLPKKVIAKSLLPNYDVFDEGRFFKPGKIRDHLFRFQGKKILLLICEDMWGWQKKGLENPLKQIKKSEVDLVISINASPYSEGKEEKRYQVAKLTARYFASPVLYVNMVGAQDELIFDGSSFAIDAKGKFLANSAFCVEDLNIVDLKSNTGGQRQTPRKQIEKLHSSLVLGIRDFVIKNGFSKIHLGLSGGIDSAVIAALAADAVGPQNVAGIAMPGPFSDEKSLLLAKELAKNLGCDFSVYDIRRAYDVLVSDYEKVFGVQPFGLLHENIQARLRGNVLMMYANSHQSLLLSTGNKSEYATGYSTLYGDMCGALAPLGDLLKRDVYALAEYYNLERELIPQQIISRPPSAELRPNQKDQDTLPPYEELDKAVDRIVTEQKPARTELDHWLLKKIAVSEFKRWQAPPILRVTPHAFGRGRRFPITNQFKLKPN
jgi:NAD+ synthase (glutamine-hydrolysing)